MGLGDRFAPTGLVDHVGERKAREVLTHVISHVSPHAEQHALALVIARAVLMGFSKVASRDRPVDRCDNLSQSYGFGGPSEDVSASNAALGTNESHTLQTEQDLLEVGLGSPVRSARSRTEVGDW